MINSNSVGFVKLKGDVGTYFLFRIQWSQDDLRRLLSSASYYLDLILEFNRILTMFLDRAEVRQDYTNELQTVTVLCVGLCLDVNTKFSMPTVQRRCYPELFNNIGLYVVRLDYWFCRCQSLLVLMNQGVPASARIILYWCWSTLDINGLEQVGLSS